MSVFFIIYYKFKVYYFIIKYKKYHKNLIVYYKFNIFVGKILLWNVYLNYSGKELSVYR